MGLKDKLRAFSKPAIAAVALATASLDSKANETPESVPIVPAIQRSASFSKHSTSSSQPFISSVDSFDNRLFGIEIAPANGLKVVSQVDPHDVLDPEGNFQTKTENSTTYDGGFFEDGHISSQQVLDNSSEEGKSGHKGEENFKNEISMGQLMGHRQVPFVVIGSSYSHMSSTTKRENENVETTHQDELVNFGFRIENQQDRHNVQQWCQDSMNFVLGSDAPAQNKIKALNSLANTLYQTVNPLLDRLPNTYIGPDNLRFYCDSAISQQQMPMAELQKKVAGLSQSVLNGEKPVFALEGLKATPLAYTHHQQANGNAEQEKNQKNQKLTPVQIAQMFHGGHSS